MSEEDRVRAAKNQAEPGERLVGLALLLIFGLLAAGIVTAGYLAYRNYAEHYRVEARRQLSSIAELKVNELTQWRKERLADGGILFKNAAFIALARHVLEKPADAEAQRQISDWMGKLSQFGQYDRVWLLDPQGVTRLSVPGGQRPSAAATLRLVSDVLRSGQITFQDFYRNEHDQRVYLAVLVPICDDSAANRPLGVLVLRIDPSTYLYPFLKRWPIPSPTAETLLVRREGNEVVFLNELRFQTNTALNLRAPLDRITRPAAQAVLGRKGVMNGIDYRGVPVVAALRSIPGSPWSLVARVDETEINGPLHERLWLVSAMVTVLLFGAGAGTGIVWRHQRVRFYRERARATEALAASELRYRRFFEATQDGVLILDATTGMILDVNPFMIELLGYSHEVFLGKKVWELGFFKDLIANEHNFAELLKKNYLRYEDLALETHDGQRIEVEFTSHVYLVKNHKVIQYNIRDISARKQAEQALEKTAADLERSNQELEQFAYVASHDLQEPLRMVASYTQLLAKRYKDQLDQDAREFIGYAVDGAVRMQRLINDLLTYSRVQTQGKSFGPVDAHSALGEALVNLASAIEESGGIITNDDLPMVTADRTQLVQLFQNLIGNALKFHGEPRPHVHVSVARETADAAPASGPRRSPSTFWTFSVRDNGIGIEPPYFERIFVVFQRLHGQAKYPGTGIGLALCKRIVERHGGRIWVESKIGQGTTFHFTLPGVV
jgi:PAS domain S-box-containing protein